MAEGESRKDLISKGSVALGAITSLTLTDKGIETMVKESAAAIWDKAASEYKITSPIAAGRNEAHKTMFLNAAAVKANGDTITELSWPNRRGRSA